MSDFHCTTGTTYCTNYSSVIEELSSLWGGLQSGQRGSCDTRTKPLNLQSYFGSISVNTRLCIRSLEIRFAGMLYIWRRVLKNDDKFC